MLVCRCDWLPGESPGLKDFRWKPACSLSTFDSAIAVMIRDTYSKRIDVYTCDHAEGFDED